MWYPMVSRVSGTWLPCRQSYAFGSTEWFQGPRMTDWWEKQLIMDGLTQISVNLGTRRSFIYVWLCQKWKAVKLLWQWIWNECMFRLPFPLNLPWEGLTKMPVKWIMALRLRNITFVPSKIMHDKTWCWFVRPQQFVLLPGDIKTLDHNETAFLWFSRGLYTTLFIFIDWIIQYQCLHLCLLLVRRSQLVHGCWAIRLWQLYEELGLINNDANSFSPRGLMTQLTSLPWLSLSWVADLCWLKRYYLYL